MKKLPLGIKSITKLLEEDYLYIDKTMYYKELINEGKYYFLSRPRRFGKTLFISTLKEIFKGNKELFKDQNIYSQYAFRKHPVIHIDFNLIDHKSTIEAFEEEIKITLLEHAKEYHVDLKKGSLKRMLINLVKELNKINEVVILIDEYDKPIVDAINDLERANQNKSLLSSFYETIKGLGEYLGFVLLTGVTKVSKTSVFSKLNNLTDLTIDSKYAGMLGIKEDELYDIFDDYFQNASKIMGLSIEDLKKNLKSWYNGYSWNGKVKVYNPYSILSFFKFNRFDNYWFKTGTPTFLIEMMQRNQYNLPDLENLTIGSTIFDEFDLEFMDTTSLLLQTGYLTIKDVSIKKDMESYYTLSIPNYEVRRSLFDRILQLYTGESISKVKPTYLKMISALEESNVEAFVKHLSSSFAEIPYTIYPKKEDYYHSIFYLMMNLIGAEIQVEVLTDKGRIDGVLIFEEHIFIIEFKVGSAKEGIKQIKSRKYYEKYLKLNKKIILLSIGGFNDKTIEYIQETVH